MKRLALISLGLIAVNPAPRLAAQPVRSAQPQTVRSGQSMAARPPAPPSTPSTATPQNAAPASSSEAGHYVGVASCANSGCHGGTQPLNSTHVLQNEYYTWLNSDRHAKAYNVLFSDRSARIARNMRLKGKAYQEAVCLDCHSTNVASRLVSGHIDPEDGVQCEACHGPASGWRAEHTEAGWSHEKSVARGMIDLRSLTVRGSSCLSCHMGNAAREVDHDLIAAGHPILAFELDNYTATMPPHWHPNDTQGVRAWAVGQIVAFRDSADNLARHARGGKWPEFSDMSCYNCHHALKSSGWRQERGWPDRPGLPAWSPQHWAVLRQIVGSTSPSAKNRLDDLVQQIASGVARMNDPAGIARAADEARTVANRVIPAIDATRWSDAQVRSLISAIADDRDFVMRSDVHSAEQIALALQSLAASLTRRDSRLLRSGMLKAIDGLFAELKDRDDYDPSRFVEKLQALKASV